MQFMSMFPIGPLRRLIVGLRPNGQSLFLEALGGWIHKKMARKTSEPGPSVYDGESEDTIIPEPPSPNRSARVNHMTLQLPGRSRGNPPYKSTGRMQVRLRGRMAASKSRSAMPPQCVPIPDHGTKVNWNRRRRNPLT